MFADGDAHQFELPHLVTAWLRDPIEWEVFRDLIVDPSILVSDVPPSADRLAAIAASRPPLLPPLAVFSTPSLSKERSDQLAAALGMDLPTYRTLMQLQRRDITPEDLSLLGSLDESLEPSKLDGAVLRLFPTETFRSDSDEPNTCTICLEPFADGDQL